MLERSRLVKQARDLNDKAEKEKRDFTQEEQNQYDALTTDVESLGKRIQRNQALEDIESELEQPDGDDPNRPDPESEDESDTPPTRRGPLPVDVADRYAGVVRQMMAARDPRVSREYRAGFRSFLMGERVSGLQRRSSERRDLQADSDPQAGYLKAPPQFVAGLLKSVDDVLFFRQPGWATVIAMAAADELIGISLDADPDDGEWTSEIGEIDYDESMSFGRRSLKPVTLAKGIKLSRKLLRVAPDSEAIVTDRLRYKLAVPMEKAYMAGSGTNQALGVFTPSNNGISTARDVSTGNTTTALTFDGLTEAKYTLKPQYWPRAKWLFHRTAVKKLMLVKDTTGNYIWRESVRTGEPDTLLGGPVFMSEFAPSTFTASKYVGMWADFSYYWIADALSMELQRVLELYSKTRQIGLHAWLETDGMPVLEEAFVRIQLAAS
jgi:HK97 family phage major capsid protein